MPGRSPDSSLSQCPDARRRRPRSKWGGHRCCVVGARRVAASAAFQSSRAGPSPHPHLREPHAGERTRQDAPRANGIAENFGGFCSQLSWSRFDRYDTLLLLHAHRGAGWGTQRVAGRRTLVRRGRRLCRQGRGKAAGGPRQVAGALAPPPEARARDVRGRPGGGSSVEFEALRRRPHGNFNAAAAHAAPPARARRPPRPDSPRAVEAHGHEPSTPPMRGRRRTSRLLPGGRPARVLRPVLRPPARAAGGGGGGVVTREGEAATTNAPVVRALLQAPRRALRGSRLSWKAGAARVRVCLWWLPMGP